MKAPLAVLVSGAMLSSLSLWAVADAVPAATTTSAVVGLPGAFNAITDVPGIDVGQVQSIHAPYLTGTTVVHATKLAVTGVDQRGGAPATKETDLLNPENANPGVNAVMLGGSSMYGLGATDGVIRWLEDRGEGITTGPGVAPIVPAADIYDLGRGGNFEATTKPAWGYLAAEAAKTGPVREGSVGGGAGAVSGGLKSGVGTASVDLGNGIVVGAIVVVNSAGSAVDPRDCSLYAQRFELAGEFRGLTTPAAADCKHTSAASPQAALNTTIAVVATNAPLEKAAAARMAENSHDGMARAIDPIHTLYDGDTVFAMSTGSRDALRVNNPDETAQLTGIFAAAEVTLSRAIGHALLGAVTAGGIKGYCDTYPSACAHLAPVSPARQGTAPDVTQASVNRAANALAAGVPPLP
ncbi:MAG: hydrolase [Amycolatopsis sp.]|uniref:P1 family peptidase n=1 Tax=Amycolatopsis sp. TaxID=37632 RepID=UPI00260B642A|nr:P1 family peptidase [Amycolatopsis sp.]MCU1682768.1 hydrolase [Amycolatopsis sp.]